MENVTWKWLVISWILGLLISPAESQQPSGALSFEKEKIRINIHDNEYQLIGDYYFKNNSSQQLFSGKRRAMVESIILSTKKIFCLKKI